MDRTIIDVPVISDALRRLGVPVSPLVRLEGRLYTCGMPPLDPLTGEIVEGDIATQTRAVMEALKVTLAAGGATFEQVAKVNVFLTDNADAPAMNAVYRDYFRNGFPARTCVAVQAWPRFDIEIECIAAVP